MKLLEITVSGTDEALLKKVEQFAARLGLQVQFRRPEKPLPLSNKKKSEDKDSALEAINELTKLNAFKDIEDPARWERELRKDRSL